MKFIDTHCHIDLVLEKTGWSFETLLNNVQKNSIEHMIHIGTNLKDSSLGIERYSSSEYVSLSGGLHPCELSDALNENDESSIEEELLKIMKSPSIVAIGETGLDYINTTLEKEKITQLKWFDFQAQFSKKSKKPLVIHCRNAFKACFDLLKKLKIDSPVIFHCFTGDREMAKIALDLGCFLSFSGILTFKNAQELREAATFAPLDRIILETDAPFLTPAPHRGGINHSGFLPLTGKCLSALKKTTLEEIAIATTKTAKKIFSLR